jgi:hypothetical protein
MAIKKYTNFDAVNAKTTNEGNYLQSEDLFIVSKNEIEDTDFGDCKYDVMEVSVYDINNNLLPHKSGKNVEHVKYQHIGNYLYSMTNKGGQKEIAIDAEKLLNDLGFTNGIVKLNLNFVRQRVGSDDELQRVWIQEISPSREEIRIIPLKTKDANINQIINNEFKNVNNLTKDFKYYKKNILDALDSFEFNFLSTIDDALVAKFGNDFRATVRKDFGLRDLDAFNKRVFENFRDSVKNWVNNRYYDISQSTFGKPSEIRFNDCEQYPFRDLLNEIQNILNNCIAFNVKSLKKRSVNYTQIPKEFGIVELRKQIQDNLDSFSTRVDIKKNVYSPGAAAATISGTQLLPPITTVVEVPVAVDPPKPPVAPKVEPPEPPVTPPPAKVAPPTVETTPKPNLQDTKFSTAAQQAAGLGAGGGTGTKYIPVGLDGTTNYYNGFDTRGFEDLDADITGRDF